MTYILFHKNGGWFTKSAVLHSDPKQAMQCTADEARDYVKLHEGRLVPVDREFYFEAIKGVKQ
jgi:hypothetical protein